MRTLLAILILVSSIIIGQSELTVEKAIEIGLKNNYDIQLARQNVKIAKTTQNLVLPDSYQL